MWNSGDIADQITGRNDNKLGIHRTNLGLKYCQIFITYFNSMHDNSLNEIGLATFITRQMSRFLCFQNVMACFSYTTDKCFFKVKSRNTILICCLRSGSTINASKWCHAVFTFNFEHIQQINQIFLSLTLHMYLSVGHRINPQNNLSVR